MSDRSLTLSRLPHLDQFKLMASNFIVLHHLAAYGPISDVLAKAHPDMIAWLYEYARTAVQVFIVIAGYLAGKSLSRAGQHFSGAPFDLIGQRYRRLILPYIAALVLAILAALLARQWMSDTSIPAVPSWRQALAHVFLLQNLLGYDSLSAGVWYIAIDFQLYVMLTFLLWLGSLARQWRAGRWLVMALLLASLFYFNRDDSWDNWAVYFFGSYALGAVAAWSADSRRPNAHLLILAMVGLAALALDFRERIALAVVIALVLGLLQRRKFWLPELPQAQERSAPAKANIFYSLFLVHFPVCLLGNTLFSQLGLSDSPAAAMLAFLACWGLSVVAAYLFYRWVELPLSRR
jgi:peptidoglycan/LPS O-acetylase OafA/YrhL